MIEKTDSSMFLKGAIIEGAEDYIDAGLPIYLITYCPNPEELPDADFRMQHEFSVSLLADYLKCCRIGLFCVEATQLGNPHYHGWYQIDDLKEQHRLVMIKTLQKFGLIKIAKCRSHKVNCWTERKNGLYYYKKDCLDAMLHIDINPITRYSESNVDWNSITVLNFFTKEIKNPKRVEDKISDQKFYRQFYQYSL